MEDENLVENEQIEEAPAEEAPVAEKVGLSRYQHQFVRLFLKLADGDGQVLLIPKSVSGKLNSAEIAGIVLSIMKIRWFPGPDDRMAPLREWVDECFLPACLSVRAERDK